MSAPQPDLRAQFGRGEEISAVARKGPREATDMRFLPEEGTVG